MTTKIEEYKGYHFIIVDNGVLKITLSDLGASLYSIVFENKEMLLTPRALEDFVNDNYYGKIIGRIAGRVENGLLEIDGKSYQLPINENGNTLHSAEEGLHNKVFTYHIESNNVESKIIFSYLSREDQQSLPGDALIKITYIIKENDSNIKLLINLDSNKDTVTSLTNHLYFSLGAHNLKETRLQIKASNFVHTRKADLIPLYAAHMVSCLDYQTIKPTLFDIDNLFLQDHASYGVDHYFIFDKPGLNEPNIILESDKFILTVFSDFEGAQIYTCNYIDGIEKRTCLNDRYEGIAIEPEVLPLNIKNGQHFAHQIIYSFKKK